MQKGRLRAYGVDKGVKDGFLAMNGELAVVSLLLNSMRHTVLAMVSVIVLV